jgi:hypothetical protein
MRLLHGVDRAKQRQDNGVVSAEGNNSWMMFAIEGERYEGFPGDRVIAQRRKGCTLKKCFVTADHGERKYWSQL